MRDPRVAKARRLLIVGSQLGQLVHEAIAAHMDEELTKNAYVMVLFALDEAEVLRPGQIQAMSGLSSGGVSKLLDRLQAAGLVKREYGLVPDDRRASTVTLTAKGRQVITRIADEVVARLSGIQVLVKEMEGIVAD